MTLRRYLTLQLYFKKDCISTKSADYVSSTPPTMTFLVGNQRLMGLWSSSTSWSVHTPFLPLPAVLGNLKPAPAVEGNHNPAPPGGLAPPPNALPIADRKGPAKLVIRGADPLDHREMLPQADQNHPASCDDDAYATLLWSLTRGLLALAYRRETSIYHLAFLSRRIDACRSR